MNTGNSKQTLRIWQYQSLINSMEKLLYGLRKDLQSSEFVPQSYSIISEDYKQKTDRKVEYVRKIFEDEVFLPLKEMSNNPVFGFGFYKEQIAKYCKELFGEVTKLGYMDIAFELLKILKDEKVLGKENVIVDKVALKKLAVVCQYLGIQASFCQKKGKTSLENFKDSVRSGAFGERFANENVLQSMDKAYNMTRELS